MSNNLQQLREISLADVARLKSQPTPRIKSDYDVDKWRTTQSYQDYGIFLRRLNESVVGHDLPYTSPGHSQVGSPYSSGFIVGYARSVGCDKNIRSSGHPRPLG